MDNNTKQNVLIVAAHVDDELLTMGGALLEHLKRKDDILILIFTTRDGFTRSHVEEVFDAFVTEGVVSLRVGVTPSLDVRDQKLDDVPESTINGVIEKALNDLDRSQNTVVYTHSMNDINTDHRIIAQCTKVACRPYGNMVSNKPIAVYAASPRNSDGFNPTHFIPLSGKEQLELKTLVESYPNITQTEWHALEVKLMANGILCDEQYAEGLEVIYQKSVT
jgi:LmbE family N-acetylglucosaminyl deacetylase